jgi:hypothetical protein
MPESLALLLLDFPCAGQYHKSLKMSLYYATLNRSVVLACLPLVLAASECAAQQLCQSVRALVQASYSDFNSIKRSVVRHGDGTSEWGLASRSLRPGLRIPHFDCCPRSA